MSQQKQKYPPPFALLSSILPQQHESQIPVVITAGRAATSDDNADTTTTTTTAVIPTTDPTKVISTPTTTTVGTNVKPHCTTATITNINPSLLLPVLLLRRSSSPKRQKNENNTTSTTTTTIKASLQPPMTDIGYLQDELNHNNSCNSSSHSHSTTTTNNNNNYDGSSSIIVQHETTTIPTTTTTNMMAQKSIHDYYRNTQMLMLDDNTDSKLPALLVDDATHINNNNNNINNENNTMSIHNNNNLSDPQTVDMAQQDREDDDDEAAAAAAVVVVDVLSTCLTEDVIIKILNFCNIFDLLHGIGMTNHYYYTLSFLDTVGWDIYYTKYILKEKYHIQRAPTIPSHVTECKRTMVQYAVIDSKRQCITVDELCYDISGTIWSFRFKGAAGIDWTAADPWHQGQPCRKMAFLQNGTVMIVLDNAKNGPSNITTTTIATTTESSTTISNNVQLQHEQPNYAAAIVEKNEIALHPPPLPMTWRFLTRPMDLPTRPMGSYIRIHVGNRDVPTYTCIRSPTNNWGFVFESCWGIYANFELPPKRMIHTNGIPTTTTTTTTTLHTRRHDNYRANDNDDNENDTIGNDESQHRSDVIRGPIHNPESWLQSGPNENDPVEDVAAVDMIYRPQQHNQQRPITVADMQDETMLLTNEIQWREAFLYNVGARILPEGDEATYEFDRYWQNSGTNNNNNDNNNTNDIAANP